MPPNYSLYKSLIDQSPPDYSKYASTMNQDPTSADYLDQIAQYDAMQAPPAASPVEEASPAPQQVPDPLSGVGNIDPKLRKQLEAALQESLASQKSGIQDMSEIAKLRLAQPQQLDLSPLMALSDSLTGSKLLSGYKKPLSPEENAQHAMDIQGTIQKQQGKLTEDQIKYLSNEIGNKGLAGMIRGQVMQDRLMSQAADTVHKAPNLKTYTDLTNNLAESLFLLHKPDITVTEAHEVMSALTRAINRSNVTSDYKQKQFEMPTLEEKAKNLAGLIQSNPNQPAPGEVVNLLNKIGSRVFDTYGASIGREASRVTKGKAYQYQPAQQAMENAAKYYSGGQYMNELRSQYGIKQSELNNPKLQSQVVQKPNSVNGKPVTQEKWNSYSPEDQKTLWEHRDQ